MSASDSNKPVPFWLREVPNIQILETAESFHHAFEQLVRHPAEGTILPALHNAAIALELYLKSLSATEELVAREPGSDAGLLYAKTPTNHQLADLWATARDDAKAFIQQEADQQPRLREFESVADALQHFQPAFVATRYPYEFGRDVSFIRIDVIASLLDALNHAIRRLPVRYEQAPPGP